MADLSRRLVIILILAIAVPGIVAAADDAGAFVDTLGRETMAALDRIGDDPEARRQAIASLLDKAVDLPRIARLCLGRHWRTADDAQRSAHAFADRETYAAAVLGRPLPPAEPVDLLDGGPLEVVLGLLTALGSVALAFALLRELVPVPRTVRMSFERVRRLHSGQIGDYVAWATVGFALLGGLFALAS